MGSIREILKQYWGYDKFRYLQEDIILSVLEGNDTLALLPTGGGKSICYQVPGLAREGLCIVISPLIALMKDQVEQLKKKGVPSVAVFSGLSKREIDIALDNCVYGNIKFLYLSPERIRTEIFIERVKKMKVNLLAIDEAHCISQWGYDFRPSYLKIAELRELLPEVPVIALTATATEKVKKDIQEKLEFKNGRVFQKSFVRDNLSYSCFRLDNKEKKLVEVLSNVPGSSIVYVRSRKRSEEIAYLLQRKGFRSSCYHAGLPNEIRNQRQNEWIENKIRVIVATNAFGMGIDKPDVRSVIHWDLPESPEAYYQEAGRAGRDEKKAYAVLLFTDHDLKLLEQKIKEAYPDTDFIRKVYQSLANYYKIAVGSSNLASYDFDLEEFERTFKLPKAETYYALKRLESEGFIQFNESFFISSRLKIIMEHKSLYEFQISNEKFDGLIKTVLRMYGGEAFSDFVFINENHIAKNTGKSASEIISQLKALDSIDVLAYDMQKDKPQIVFTTPRFDAVKLPLDGKKIEEKKKTDFEKMEAVINYARQDMLCRTAFILEYFGEYVEKDCGICDICLRKKKAEKLPDFKTLRECIVSLLQTESREIDFLVAFIGKNEKDSVIECLRKMNETGEIEIGVDNIVKLIRK
jgi:ATP-dependent DNA helicase RecQ